MPQFVSCPKCGRRARVPDTLIGKSVKCPGCTETFTAAASPPPAPTKKEADSGEDIEVVGDEKGEHPGEEGRDEERRRRLDDDDEDDEEEDRPRKRKKKRRRQVEGEGPWLLAIGAAGACVVVSFFFSLLVEGTAGLPPAKDGPIVKYIGLGIGLIGALALIGIGVNSVKKREVMSWYYHSMQQFTGTLAIVLGMFEAAVGGLLGGWVVYGLFFTLLRGR
jgi:hypothetical protein